jgi:predicted transcriptional regulator
MTPPPGPVRRRASGQLEAEILAVLHRADGPLTAGDVAERLNGPLAYTTVVTILGRLHTKRQLTRVPRGRAYAYAPVADPAGLAARRMRGLLDERTDRKDVLARFVDGLTAADEDLLRRLLGPGAGHRR